ncbi:MAG: hypothetical protein GY761_10875 [Hyphomicrobiales bacterium]|nr:hypothetical protein [Hyphomicrobiales bacterium]
MPDTFRYASQFLFFTIVAVFVGYFSNQPVHRHFPEGMAQIKLGFAHGAKRKIDCRKLTAKEIAKLPANQRRPNNCTRGRIPIHVQLILDGKILYDDLLIATGLFQDGRGKVYRKITVPVGPHTITARLRDSKRASGFDYETTRQVVLQPYQNIAIDFRADAGGFLFR